MAKKTAIVKREGIGKGYQATSRALMVTSPLWEAALDPELAGQSRGDFVLKTATGFSIDASFSASRALPYWKGLLDMGFQGVLDAKLGQTAALTRGSVTALLPEAFAVWRGFRVARDRESPIRGIIAYNNTKFGFIAGSNPFYKLTQKPHMVYLGAKYGGAILRRAANKERAGFAGKILRPIKQGLKAVGLTA